MATERTYELSNWYGLMESEDGDTKLRLGDATECLNWKITRDKVGNRSGGNLRRRFGTKTLWSLGAAVKGLWTGLLADEEVILAAADGHMYKLELINGVYSADCLGNLETDDVVTFFPYNKVVYILNGHEFYQYDGDRFSMVVGYRPLIQTATVPAGGGTLLEQVNKLNGLRRVWFSPDGTSTVFTLPESDLVSIDYVKYTSSDTYVSRDDYAVSRTLGTVTFDTAPASGTNTIEIGYIATSTYREQVTKMKYMQFYAGEQTSRILIYGDGSNEFLYSSMDYDGVLRADYFPDLNETALGDSNTPITGMVRHYSNLIVYKPTEAYSLVYSLTEDSDGDYIEAFYGKSINSRVGNIALGQVCLVDNNPITVCGKDLYRWINTSSYSSNLTIDERQAKRISDRVYASLNEFDRENVYCYDDNDNQEYYVCDPVSKEALVHNYVTDAWYKYDNFDMRCAISINGDLYFGTSDGKVKRFSDEYYNDDGTAISARWMSGSIAFDAPQMRKFISKFYITIRPESHGYVKFTVTSDKKGVYAKKPVESTLMDFTDIDFENISFDVNRTPKTHRLKIKAKKFVYINLILETEDDSSSATITNITMPVRYSGYAK